MEEPQGIPASGTDAGATAGFKMRCESIQSFPRRLQHNRWLSGTHQEMALPLSFPQASGYSQLVRLKDSASLCLPDISRITPFGKDGILDLKRKEKRKLLLTNGKVTLKDR